MRIPSWLQEADLHTVGPHGVASFPCTYQYVKGKEAVSYFSHIFLGVEYVALQGGVQARKRTLSFVKDPHMRGMVSRAGRGREG